MNADIECIGYDTKDQRKRPRYRGRTPEQYWSSSNLYWAVLKGHEDIAEALFAHLTQMKVEIPSLTVESVHRALYSAAHSGYFSITKMLLDLDSNSIRPPDYYDTVLSYALGEEDYWYNERYCSCTKQDICSESKKKSLTDHYATVKLLLDLGAHCNYIGSQFSSDMPLLLALFKCSSFANGILKLLIERGARVSSKDVLHGFVETSNWCSFANEETANLLVDHGADSSVRDYIGTTVLNKNNKKGLIELLAACGLTLAKIDGWGIKETSEDRAELMEQLLDLDANIKYRTASGPNPLQSPISDRSNPYEFNSDEDELNGLGRFGHPTSERKTEEPDYETCVSFIHKSVKHLLSYGADGSIGNWEEQTPLYKTDNERLVKLILDHGADVNVVDSYGQTPLHAMTYGASKAMVGTIELLLKHGADIGAKNADDNTPLHLAVLTSAREVLNLLLAHGADWNSRNSDGETPMDLLAHRRSHQEQFSFNRNKKGDLMAFRYQKLPNRYWRGWETFEDRPHYYYH
ncbi:hypothetical protein N7471_004169 [Penicillium samsonianum]|uniref:uncharacterized protein n=1 Tax=Penicillium samsonianum TaxID=1882272 RepID=UPI0025474C36|nr:uncharacterized protein N7471_004169 [Penicillium samsonianum]KAJ6137683.1 hypothetical protein N7471_004169 [Penicillium samsonianum]